ncbi:MAG: molybdenum cofactor guanylyltransferase, partial [Acidimicrobiales bacterium]
MTSDLAGAVLAGGASRRFGSDKAMFQVDGSTMLERAVSLLMSVKCDPILIVGGSPEQRAVPATIHVLDNYPGEGPLGGVLSALARTDSQWTMVIACDLPYLSSGVLQTLLAHQTNADVVVVETPRGPEPLVGLYSQTARMPFEAAFSGGTRAMRDALALVSVDYVPMGASDELRNVNRVEDL